MTKDNQSKNFNLRLLENFINLGLLMWYICYYQLPNQQISLGEFSILLLFSYLVFYFLNYPLIRKYLSLNRNQKFPELFILFRGPLALLVVLIELMLFESQGLINLKSSQLLIICSCSIIYWLVNFLFIVIFKNYIKQRY